MGNAKKKAGNPTSNNNIKTLSVRLQGKILRCYHADVDTRPWPYPTS